MVIELEAAKPSRSGDGDYSANAAPFLGLIPGSVASGGVAATSLNTSPGLSTVSAAGDEGRHVGARGKSHGGEVGAIALDGGVGRRDGRDPGAAPAAGEACGEAGAARTASPATSPDTQIRMPFILLIG